MYLRLSLLDKLVLSLSPHPVIAVRYRAPSNGVSAVVEHDHRDVLAIADLDHRTVGVVEEELIDGDATFHHSAIHVPYLHLPQLLLHRFHAFALLMKDTSKNFDISALPFHF